jgi:pyruvate dehydrogenase E2 component (dihydrolipoamide acetyltransferase)
LGIEREVRVPDIGEAKDAEVIEILVSVGDKVEPGDSLVTIESEKASIEIPCPFGGVVKEMCVSVGDRVSEGQLLVVLEAGPGATKEEALAAETELRPTKEEAPAAEAEPPRQVAAPQPAPPPPEVQRKPLGSALAGHASPSVRRFARELGTDLALVRGSGRKGRILKTDVQAFVKGALGGGAPIRIPETVVQFEFPPEIDFGSFGEVEVQPFSKIRRLSAAHLHRSWVTVPHVTQHDEADITDLETFRNQHTEEAEKHGVKLTILPFLMKAVVRAIREYPQFGASLDRSGENLIVKKYYHLGIAVDTPNGLVVPVIRDVDRKSAFDLAADLAHMSKRARDRRLRPQDLQGGCFSISSLGGIGGTAFTPIVNTPEVAILGVSRSSRKPVWVDGEFVARLMLPLSLSYDHRVIDGAAAVRFTTRLCELLADVRSLLL